ncbi:MAG TPA: BON domain-containing protein [bacterium]|nr:BON domain-containing protein [bacterium]
MPQKVLKSDVEIQKEVLEELRWDGRVLVTDIGVEVDKGIVTLTGTVTSYAKKTAAQEAAHKVRGVLDVANDIQVHIPSTGARTDTEVAQAIRQALEWNVFVPHERIQSTVADGHVTLSGTVEMWAQRDETYRTVAKLEGVKNVLNNVTVVPAERLAPEKIRAAIENALTRRAEREAKGIIVTVQDGEARLSGKVHSWAERHAAVESASHAPGVKIVKDLLVVAPDF